MATHDWVIARLGSTINSDDSLRLVRKSGISLAEAAGGGSGCGKIRDMNSLWRSGLSANIRSTNISDPLADEAADMEAQDVVARFFVRDTRSSHASAKGPQDASEIMNLVQFQSALQASARVLSRIAIISSRF
jgi:hypothetical protein